MAERVPLDKIADEVPLGFECRSCGAAAYNWLKKCAYYVERGDICCANFRDWVQKAEARQALEARHD